MWLRDPAPPIAHTKVYSELPLSIKMSNTVGVHLVLRLNMALKTTTGPPLPHRHQAISQGFPSQNLRMLLTSTPRPIAAAAIAAVAAVFWSQPTRAEKQNIHYFFDPWAASSCSAGGLTRSDCLSPTPFMYVSRL